MLRVVTGVLLALHGMVHLLYVGQSTRAFELQPGMTWPDGSWLLASLTSAGTARTVASVTYTIAAIGFVGAGIGVWTGQGWWRVLAVAAAAFSTVMVLLLWDATLQRLPDQGAVAVLINVAIGSLILVFNWPRFDF